MYTTVYEQESKTKAEKESALILEYCKCYTEFEEASKKAIVNIVKKECYFGKQMVLIVDIETWQNK